MEPLDIWRSAKVVVDLHGNQAPWECRRRVNAFKDKSDADSAAVWEAIAWAAKELLENGPPDDLTSR